MTTRTKTHGECEWIPPRYWIPAKPVPTPTTISRSTAPKTTRDKDDETELSANLIADNRGRQASGIYGGAMRLLTLASVAVAAIATIGCSDNATANQAELAGRTFVSVQVEGDQIPGGGPLTVGFDGSQISTFAGCNHGSGTADLADGRITTQLAMTMMACAPPVGDSDAWVSKFFEDRPTWTLSGDDLTLRTDAAIVTLRDKKVVDPDRPLTGTTWQVTSLVSAQAVSTSVALEQAKPTLTIADDGTVSGSTGCNQITGRATVSGSPAIIEFGPVATTRKACPPEVGEVEQAVLGVLKGTVQTSIDADQLKLTGADGNGLVLRAQ